MPSRVIANAVIAGFRVQSLIGSGSMGSVYLAEDTRTGQPVALKVMAAGLAEDERFRQRFVRESALAATLDHPHIVRTIASGEADGLLFLAMAFVDGSDLRDVLRREGRLEPDRALRLIAQTAEALDAAHAAGLVHRDVKPGNILMGPGGEHAYVCDFGLARHVSSVSSLTGDRGFVGTIDYVPPEQIQGGAVDGRTDVYSLGCVLFECLAGARPFERESELSVIFAHLNEPPPRLSELRPELPAGFDEVVATALAKAPEDRYRTCGELAWAARAALQGRMRVRPRRRRRRWLTAALALAAAAAVAGAVLHTRGGSPGPTTPQAAPVQITENAIAGATTGRTAAFYEKRFGGYRFSALAKEPFVPVPLVPAAVRGRVLPGEGQASDHHRHLEPGLPNRQGNRALLDDRRDEAGLRQRGPALLVGIAARRDQALVRGRRQPPVRHPGLAHDLGGRPLPRCARAHARIQSAVVRQLHRRERNRLPLAPPGGESIGNG